MAFASSKDLVLSYIMYVRKRRRRRRRRRTLLSTKNLLDLEAVTGCTTMSSASLFTFFRLGTTELND